MNYPFVTLSLPAPIFFRGRHIITSALLLVLSTSVLFAGDVDKAFKYLNTGDYPNAKK